MVAKVCLTESASPGQWLSENNKGGLEEEPVKYKVRARRTDHTDGQAHTEGRVPRELEVL